MSCHTKVLNTSKNSQLKRSQAARWVAEGLAVWIEEDYSIRECSFTETLEIRGKLQQIDRLMACPSGAIAPAEVEGVSFCPSRQIDWQADGELKQSASWFALACIRETLVQRTV